jgi:hypothetical protein
MADNGANHVGVRNAIANLLHGWPAFEKRMRTEIEINALLKKRLGADIGETSRLVWVLRDAFNRANEEQNKKQAMTVGNDLKNALDRKTPPELRGLTFTLALLFEEGVKNGNMAPGAARDTARELEAVFDRAYPQDSKPDSERVELPAGGSEALRRANAEKIKVGVTPYVETEHHEDELRITTGLRMKPLTEEDEAKLGQYDEFDNRYPSPEVADAVRKRATAFRRRLHACIGDNAPGNPVEDRRLDRLVDELAVLIAEVAYR